MRIGGPTPCRHELSRSRWGRGTRQLEDAGHDDLKRAAKIRRLELLLRSGLCPARRGKWYAEPRRR